MVGCTFLPSSGKAVQIKLNSVQNQPQTAFIDVAAATLWTQPDRARPIDEPSLTNPVDLWKWTKSMTVDQKRWLVGELQTQALYGNKVTILQEKGDWVKVAVHGQPTPKNKLGYPAWMPKAQLAYNDRFNQYQGDPFALITSPTAWLYNDAEFHHQFKEISFNTRLPVIKEKQHKKAVLVATPSDGNKWIKAADVAIYPSEEAIPEPTGEDLVRTAKKFLGLPYLWAGTSGFGFDCSGFTYTIYKSYGITIPRDSSVQAVHGKPIDKKDLQPGDLVFFAYNHGKGYVHHVGMYVGNGKMINSPNSSTTVKISDIFDSPYWADQYAGARRYIKD
ncbi:MAG TPA: C40 family peptidase [Bacillales bacterium]|nr:C40 family peptidase [Bacillales bacterium]